MEADIAGLYHDYKRRRSEQPKRGGDRMDVDDRRYGRMLMQVVVQIEAEAHEYPEEAEPDQCSSAIVTRGP